MVILVGVGSAMFGPAYSSVLPGLVGRADMPGAISLNSAQMNGSRVVGPIIGGLLFPVIGPAWIFVINAATYLFVIATLLAVSLPLVAQQLTAKASRWRELIAGVSVARHDRIVGRCLVTVFVFSLLALAFIGQMPTVAAHNLHIKPSSTSYGILYACFGTGALIGAISIGTVFAQTSKPLIVRVCLIGYAVSLTVFALLRTDIPAFFLIAVVGAFYFAFITALNTTLQAQLEDAIRGRVMALWMMGFGGTVGVGNLMIGPVVSAIGITPVLIFGAGIALILSWYANVRSDQAEVGELGLNLAQ
jgi:predicted MFS family arabinose efflux permease